VDPEQYKNQDLLSLVIGENPMSSSFFGTVSDRPTITSCEGWNAGQRSGSIQVVSQAYNSGESRYCGTSYELSR
jgi:hypothetical protein